MNRVFRFEPEASAELEDAARLLALSHDRRLPGYWFSRV